MRNPKIPSQPFPWNTLLGASRDGVTSKTKEGLFDRTLHEPLLKISAQMVGISVNHTVTDKTSTTIGRFSKTRKTKSLPHLRRVNDATS
jgi:hypothetical protein